MKRIALLGLGEVGQGFYEVFEHEKSRVSALTGISMDLGAVLVRNMRKQRKVTPREGLLTDNPHRIINDTTTDAIVDAINDSALGYEMAVSALSHGKHFITANKALVSRHMEELHALAAQHGAAFLYEASVGGGTPLLKPLRALERAGEITSIKGILNGSCNFILTGMRERNTYESMMQRASALGYLEADPRDDVAGYDTRRKLRILCCVAFGGSVPEQDIPCEGITRVRDQDISALAQHGYEVKLLGAARREGRGVAAFVFPCALPRLTPLAGISGSLNLIEVTSPFLGRAGFMGQGAGSRPTGHAVFTDLLDAMSGAAGLSPRLGRVPPAAAPTTARFYLRGAAIPAAWADGALGDGQKTHPLDLQEVQAWLADHQEACAIMLEP